MVAAHEVDVQPSHDEHVAIAKHVLPTHHAIQALELSDAIDFGSLKHRLMTAQDAGHVGEEILRELVADRLAEVEQVGGEKARQTAWGGGCKGQEGGG